MYEVHRRKQPESGSQHEPDDSSLAISGTVIYENRHNSYNLINMKKKIPNLGPPLGPSPPRSPRSRMLILYVEHIKTFADLLTTVSPLIRLVLPEEFT